MPVLNQKPLDEEDPLATLQALSADKPLGWGDKLARFGMGVGDSISAIYGGYDPGNLKALQESEREAKATAIKNYLASRDIRRNALADEREGKRLTLDEQRIADEKQRHEDRKTFEATEDEKRRRWESGEKEKDRKAEIEKYLTTKRADQEKDDAAKMIPDLGQKASSTTEAENIKSGIAGLRNSLYGLDDIIKIRSEKGVEFLERSDVAQGKASSADLQLQLKNMYQLGVLSKSDLDMLQKLVPDDPTKMDWVPFGDPVLDQMKAFRTNLIQKINNNLKSRGLDPAPLLQQLELPKDGAQKYGLSGDEEDELKALEAEEAKERPRRR